MSILTWIYAQVTWLAILCLKLGPIPQHVAFIMDGNRRFAKRLSVKAWQGHRLGFSQLEQVTMTTA